MLTVSPVAPVESRGLDATFSPLRPGWWYAQWSSPGEARKLVAGSAVACYVPRRDCSSFIIVRRDNVTWQELDYQNHCGASDGNQKTENNTHHDDFFHFLHQCIHLLCRQRAYRLGYFLRHIGRVRDTLSVNRLGLSGRRKVDAALWHVARLRCWLLRVFFALFVWFKIKLFWNITNNLRNIAMITRGMINAQITPVQLAPVQIAHCRQRRFGVLVLAKPVPC